MDPLAKYTAEKIMSKRYKIMPRSTAMGKHMVESNMKRIPTNMTCDKRTTLKWISNNFLKKN